MRALGWPRARSLEAVRRCVTAAALLLRRRVACCSLRLVAARCGCSLLLLVAAAFCCCFTVCPLCIVCPFSHRGKLVSSNHLPTFSAAPPIDVQGTRSSGTSATGVSTSWTLTAGRSPQATTARLPHSRSPPKSPLAPAPSSIFHAAATGLFCGSRTGGALCPSPNRRRFPMISSR